MIKSIFEKGHSECATPRTITKSDMNYEFTERFETALIERLATVSSKNDQHN